LDKVVVERLLRAIVPGDDADDAEVDVREVRSRGSACTCVFIARSIKLCPGRSIFWRKFGYACVLHFFSSFLCMRNAKKYCTVDYKVYYKK